METLTQPVVLATLVTTIFLLLAYAFFVPRRTDTFEPTIDPNTNDARAIKFVATIGQELHSSLPDFGMRKTPKKPNQKLNNLIIKSGNPWNLTAHEFAFFQVATAFLGAVGGGLLWFLTSFTIEVPWFAVVGITTLLGYFIPYLKYTDQAKRRDLEFKRQLPDALDLIIISLSGGVTFPQAVRASIPNMNEGVLKEEFKSIINSIDTGRTLNEALDKFGERSPNDSIKTFVQAVKEANELDVAMEDVLASRAEASREDFFALINQKTAQLQSKMMAALTPTLIPAVIIIAVLPAAASIMSSFGS